MEDKDEVILAVDLSSTNPATLSPVDQRLEDLHSLNAEQQVEPLIVAANEQLIVSAAAVAFFSFIGTLIRVLFNRLGNISTPWILAFWPNFVGCILMGYIVEHKVRLHAHWFALYVGLATGLCGSITTFSSLMFDSTVALYGIAIGPYPVSRYLVVLVSSLSSSFVGFILGRHFAVITFPSRYSNEINEKSSLRLRMVDYQRVSFKYTLHYLRVRDLFFPLLFFSVIVVVILLIVLLPVGAYTYILFSLVFAPAGALSRWGLSFLNARYETFPLGTFIANLSGSFVLLGMQAILKSSVNSTILNVVSGVIYGFCGCLTTVSTLVLEANSMSNKYAYLYVLSSVTIVQIVYITVGAFHKNLFQ